MAAGAPPARLADAVPAADLQGASSVVVAETRAALCRTNTQGGGVVSAALGVKGAAGQQGATGFSGTCGDDSFFFFFLGFLHQSRSSS